MQNWAIKLFLAYILQQKLLFKKRMSKESPGMYTVNKWHARMPCVSLFLGEI